MNVLITGGSRGIGKGIARQLSMAGHDVLIIARSAEALGATAAELGNLSGRKIRYFECDVGNRRQLESLHSYCGETQFNVNVLVLNAGIFLEGSLTDSRAEDFEKTLSVDLVSIYHTVKMFIDDLRSHKRGRVIIIGSTAAYEPYPVGALYGVAKWALRGYGINLRKELMKEGISVTFLAPGGTLTDLWAGEDLPPNRLLEPDDIGKLVAALLTLSDQAVVEELIVRPMLGDIHE